jgi:transposase
MEEIIITKYHNMFPELNERQRRLWAASEANSLGYGGVSIISRITGLSRVTIYKGIKELKNNERLPEGRIRREGGGAKKLTDTQPQLLASLDALVEPTAKGDPMSPLRWTTKSSRRICEELNNQGFTISYRQVCRLLHTLDYQLSGNKSSISSSNDPDRNAQFEFINTQATKYMKRKTPVLSIDAKKREWIGNFKQNGKIWCPNGKPILVKDHSFPDKELGKGIPYGIYDINQNTGWVNVGIDHNTAEFAVASLRGWNDHLGSELYPLAKEIYITADAGGSNSNSGRLWRYCLQELADETGLTIHVSHFPPGTSKWNKIEHRLFNHISMNWRGQPLISLDVMIHLIANTTSSTGLKVYARIDKNKYPTGIKITDGQMKTLNIKPSKTLGKWNYTIKPRKQ